VRGIVGRRLNVWRRGTVWNRAPSRICPHKRNPQFLDGPARPTPHLGNTGPMALPSPCLYARAVMLTTLHSGSDPERESGRPTDPTHSSTPTPRRRAHGPGGPFSAPRPWWVHRHRRAASSCDPDIPDPLDETLLAEMARRCLVEGPVRCPRDGAMAQEERSGGFLRRFTIDVCPSCRGVWFDRGEVGRIAGSRELETLIVRYAGGRSDLACPRCATAMARRPVSEVTLDVCPKCHGIWMDAGELDAAARSLGNLSAVDAMSEGERRSAASPSLSFSVVGRFPSRALYGQLNDAHLKSSRHSILPIGA